MAGKQGVPVDSEAAGRPPKNFPTAKKMACRGSKSHQQPAAGGGAVWGCPHTMLVPDRY